MAVTKNRERENHRRNRIEEIHVVNISLCQQLGSIQLISADQRRAQLHQDFISLWNA